MIDKRQAYLEFLRSKVVLAPETGFAEATSDAMNPRLFPHQRDLAAWAIRGGCRAVFTSFGTGKTNIQIQILDYLVKHLTEGEAGLILCPLGVRGEFVADAMKFFGISLKYVRTNAEIEAERAAGRQYFLTNYERVRDGNIDPNQFAVVSLDEASVLRSFGSKTYQTFLTLFQRVKYKFVCTATPSPNRFKELIHYAAFLGVMDSGQALTRFFKRDSSQAGNLQIHPHKEAEFWLWVSSWATFLTTPSDLGYSDEGYILPDLQIIQHRLDVDYSTAGFDSWGQGKLVRNAAVGLRDAAREKRDSLSDRVARAKAIVDAALKGEHWIIWHDLEDERRAVEKAFAGYSIRTVYGSQDLDERERDIADFSEGKYEILATKPIIAGSGCNFQRHCHRAIYLGVGYKFNDFIQSVHRLQRFLQTFAVEIHVVYTESEDAIYQSLLLKWDQHKRLVAEMTGIVRKYGLNNARLGDEMQRSIGIVRQEVKGDLFTAANNDCVLELQAMPDSSVGMICTSVPFSDHYEYTESYNDFGHNDGDRGFFNQMDYLTPEMLRVLQPGRMACIHAKDRIVYGSVSGLGMYSVNEFSDKCVAHMKKHGFVYCGRITVVTDVVRENAQTYRLGFSENAKDGTKMGVGSPEYILLFRKLPTDQSNSYADEPVVKSKEDYTRSRWQFDAHALWRSNGNRFLRPEEIREMPIAALRAAWRSFNARAVYDFSEHVSIAEALEAAGCLPSSFMALDPVSHSPWAWDDITRMRTLNTEQARKDVEQHVCPLQLDIVERLIERYSNKGDLILDPFAGLHTVPHVAIQMGRTGYGVELNSEYWADGVGYCRAAEQKVSMPTLFDMLELEQVA